MVRNNLPEESKAPPHPDVNNDFLATYAKIILDSLLKLTGRQLIAGDLSPAETARQLFHAPFVVLAHNTEVDPVLTYANQTAMQLFAMNWEQVVITPSRYTAETPERDHRQQLLETVNRQGFIENYSGVRVSRDGRRFRISDATVWNLTDKNGIYCGQAASFDRWISL